jgi:hypothetical protein
MTDDDDAALSWDEVSDPSHTASPVIEAKPAPVVEPAETDAVVTPATSSFLLVTYGILAGAYLLYTVGWVLGLGHVNQANPDALAQIMSTALQVLAIAAPALWYGGTLVLTQNRRPIVRLLLLLGGLVATVPLPFILLGAAQ